MPKNTKLWGGRFEGTVEDWVEQFGASISLTTSWQNLI